MTCEGESNVLLHFMALHSALGNAVTDNDHKIKYTNSYTR